MLKSTHKPQIESSPLPQGWTEHKAPSGHTYYYHAASATSTYTRPTAPAIPQPQPAIVPSPDPTFAAQPFNYANAPLGQLTNPTSNGFGNYRGGDSHGPSHIHHRPRPEDRPKSKVAIPGCSPWVLVRTKLGRRFVHNLDSGESFWKFPSEVLRRVVELDRKERERKERRERGEPSESEKEEDKVEAEEDDKGYDSDEYEEVEVTDDEGDDGANKRPRIEQANEEPNGPVEFNEDDFAYQLAAMGQGEADYGEEGWDEGFDEPPLEEDSKALFRDLLNDFYINPYTPWEKVVEHGAIIEDNRYLCLPNMKSRREVFDNWSRDKMQELKERRERQEKKDPRIAYFAFLEKYATPKLYWPEFKRKYKKEPEMRNTKIQDKDQEKAYREYINRLKLPLTTLKSDLRELLESQPLSVLNRSTSLSALPSSILTDLRYTSVRATDRDPFIDTYIAIQPPAPEPTDVSAEDAAEASRLRQEREKREAALRDRERKAEEEKRRRMGREKASKGALREGQNEIRQAMHVGRDGLMGHFEDEGEGMVD